MDEHLLAAKGIKPFEVNLGFVDGFALRIGERATLVRRADRRAYGAMMDVAPGDASDLYAEESVADYVPEAVMVELADGRRVEATCYLLPGDRVSGTNTRLCGIAVEDSHQAEFP